MSPSGGVATTSGIALFARVTDGANDAGTAPAWATELFDPTRPGSFTHFYDEMSRGRLAFHGAVAPAEYAAPAGDGALAAGGAGYGAFVEAVLRQADRDVDYSIYDEDGDGAVDAVFVILPSMPAGFLDGGATGIANLGLGRDYATADGVVVQTQRGAVLRGRDFAETAGTLAHEYGHLLGLPDLFDVAGLDARDPADDSAGIGAWGLMGWGALGWRGDDGPNPLSAWSRVQLGWATEVEVTAAQSQVELAPVGRTGEVLRVPMSGREGYLLEYRDRSSFYDRDLPAEGVLIWHWTRRLAGRAFATDVRLMCADGRYRDAGYPLGAEADPNGEDNLGFWAHDAAYRAAHGGNLGDGTDPFGTAGAATFTPETNPPSRSDDGQLWVRVEDIRLEGGVARARVTARPVDVGIAEVRLHDDDHDGVLFAGEPARVSMTLENLGGVDVADLRVRLMSADALVEQVGEAAFGPLRVGGRTVAPFAGTGFPSFRLRGDFDVAHRVEARLQAVADGAVVREELLTVYGLSARWPVARWTVVDTAGNGDGRAQPGERLRLDLALAGEAPADVPDSLVRRCFEQLRVSLESANPVLATVGGTRVLLAWEDGAAVGRSGPELVVRSDAAPGTLAPVALRVATPYAGWTDTLWLEIADGADRTPPRVLGARARPSAAGLTLVVTPRDVIDGGAIAAVRVHLYRPQDTVEVAATELAWVDGQYEGAWSPPRSGPWLLRAEAVDGSGNAGLGPLQATTVVPPAAAEGADGAGRLRPLPALPGRARAAIQSVVVAPANGQVLYGLDGWRLWRSDDGGASWTPTGYMGSRRIGGAGVDAVAVDAGDPYTVVAVTAGVDATVSRDGGATWDAAGWEEVTAVQADPVVPRRAYAYDRTRGRQVVTDDGGATWRDIGAPIGSFLRANPSDSQELYAGHSAADAAAIAHSLDGGRTWESYTPDRAIGLFLVDPSAPGRLYAVSGTDLFHSADGGRTWAQRSRIPTGTSFAVITVAVHPRRAGALWASDGSGGLWRSADGGWSWVAIAPPRGYLFARGMALDPTDPDRVFLAFQDPIGYRLEVTRDGGESWAPIELPTGAPGAASLASTADGRLLVGSAAIDGAGVSHPQLFAGDGRRGWEAIPVEGDGPIRVEGGAPISDLFADPRDPHVLVATAGFALGRSGDGGRTWRRVRINGAGIAVTVRAHPTVPGRYYTAARGLHRSDDFGETWRALSGLGAFTGLELDPEDPQVLYASADSTMWRSEDGGENWDLKWSRAPGFVLALARAEGAPLRLYAVTNRGVYCSDSQGRTWEWRADLRPSLLARTVLRVDPTDGGHLYLASGAELLESDDGGRRWTRLQPARGTHFAIADLAVDADGAAWAATPLGVYRIAPEGGTAVAAGPEPEAFALAANYPNPFNGGTVIPFRLARSEAVELTVYDAAGQRVRRLLSGPLPAGPHRARWAGDDEDGRALATGLYFYRLRTASGQQATRKLLLVK